MTFKRRHSALLLAAFAGIAIGVFLLIQTKMQDIDKNRFAGNGLPKLQAPNLLIKKKARVLELYDGAALIKSYPVVFGFTPDGDKEKEGDGKTPEGEFFIFVKNPKSKFHLSLGVSYPSKEDAARGLAGGIITRAEHDAIVRAIDGKKMPPQKTALGGEIYIHGGGVARDWTWGCIAMTDEDVEEIYNALEVGTKIVIQP